MPIFRVRKTIVEVFEIRAEDAASANRMAYDGYTWTKEILVRDEAVVSMETERIRIDPACSVNDGEACVHPGVKFHAESETWVCAKHYEVIAGPVPPPAPLLAPLPAGEIPF